MIGCMWDKKMVKFKLLFFNGKNLCNGFKYKHHFSKKKKKGYISNGFLISDTFCENWHTVKTFKPTSNLILLLKEEHWLSFLTVWNSMLDLTPSMEFAFKWWCFTLSSCDAKYDSLVLFNDYNNLFYKSRRIYYKW